MTPSDAGECVRIARAGGRPMTPVRAVIEPGWSDTLAAAAPDVVAAWRAFEAGEAIRLRREVRRRAGPGSAAGIVVQLAAVTDALLAIVRELPQTAFAMPGCEEDWTVAQAIGHDVAARQGLALAASLAAGGRWPADAPTVVPGVPGPATASRDELLSRLTLSQRIVARAARTIAGHETDDCPLEHPLVGRLRCGEWLLFAGVHDLMHLEQLHGLLDRAGVAMASAQAGSPGQAGASAHARGSARAAVPTRAAAPGDPGRGSVA